MNENNLFKRNFVIDEIITKSDTGFRIQNESRIKYLLEKNEEIPEPEGIEDETANPTPDTKNQSTNQEKPAEPEGIDNENNSEEEPADIEDNETNPQAENSPPPEKSKREINKEEDLKFKDFYIYKKLAEIKNNIRKLLIMLNKTNEEKFKEDTDLIMKVLGKINEAENMFDFINTDIILNTLIREENKLLEIATKILEELKKYNKKQEKTPLSDRPKSLKKGKKEEDIKDNSTTNEDNNFKIISEDFNYYETIGNKKLYIEDNKQIIKSRIIQLLLEQKYSIIYTDILTEKVVDSMIQNNLIPELKNNEVEILVESKNLFEKLFNKVKEYIPFVSKSNLSVQGFYRSDNKKIYLNIEEKKSIENKEYLGEVIKTYIHEYKHKEFKEKFLSDTEYTTYIKDIIEMYYYNVFDNLFLFYYIDEINKHKIIRIIIDTLKSKTQYGFFTKGLSAFASNKEFLREINSEISFILDKINSENKIKYGEKYIPIKASSIIQGLEDITKNIIYFKIEKYDKLDKHIMRILANSYNGKVHVLTSNKISNNTCIQELFDPSEIISVIYSH